MSPSGLHGRVKVNFGDCLGPKGHKASRGVAKIKTGNKGVCGQTDTDTTTGPWKIGSLCKPTVSCIQKLEIAKFQELPYKNVTLWEKADRLLLLLLVPTHPGEIVRDHGTLSAIKLCLLSYKMTITQYLLLLNVNFLQNC